MTTALTGRILTTPKDDSVTGAKLNSALLTGLNANKEWIEHWDEAIMGPRPTEKELAKAMPLAAADAEVRRAKIEQDKAAFNAITPEQIDAADNTKLKSILKTILAHMRVDT